MHFALAVAKRVVHVAYKHAITVQHGGNLSRFRRVAVARRPSFVLSGRTGGIPAPVLLPPMMGFMRGGSARQLSRHVISGGVFIEIVCKPMVNI